MQEWQGTKKQKVLCVLCMHVAGKLYIEPYKYLSKVLKHGCLAVLNICVVS